METVLHAMAFSYAMGRPSLAFCQKITLQKGFGRAERVGPKPVRAPERGLIPIQPWPGLGDQGSAEIVFGLADDPELKDKGLTKV
jgi:hypothetical protein